MDAIPLKQRARASLARLLGRVRGVLSPARGGAPRAVALPVAEEPSGGEGCGEGDREAAVSRAFFETGADRGGTRHAAGDRVRATQLESEGGVRREAAGMETPVECENDAFVALGDAAADVYGEEIDLAGGTEVECSPGWEVDPSPQCGMAVKRHQPLLDAQPRKRQRLPQRRADTWRASRASAVWPAAGSPSTVHPGDASAADGKDVRELAGSSADGGVAGSRPRRASAARALRRVAETVANDMMSDDDVPLEGGDSEPGERVVVQVAAGEVGLGREFGWLGGAGKDVMDGFGDGLANDVVLSGSSAVLSTSKGDGSIASVASSYSVSLAGSGGAVGVGAESQPACLYGHRGVWPALSAQWMTALQYWEMSAEEVAAACRDHVRSETEAGRPVSDLYAFPAWFGRTPVRVDVAELHETLASRDGGAATAGEAAFDELESMGPGILEEARLAAEPGVWMP
jgi:hypothetical protein